MTMCSIKIIAVYVIQCWFYDTFCEQTYKFVIKLYVYFVYILARCNILFILVKTMLAGVGCYAVYSLVTIFYKKKYYILLRNGLIHYINIYCSVLRVIKNLYRICLKYLKVTMLRVFTIVLK